MDLSPLDYYFALGMLLVITGIFLIIAFSNIFERDFVFTVVALLAAILFGLAAAYLVGVPLPSWLPKMN